MARPARKGLAWPRPGGISTYVYLGIGAVAIGGIALGITLLGPAGWPGEEAPLMPGQASQPGRADPFSRAELTVDQPPVQLYSWYKARDLLSISERTFISDRWGQLSTEEFSRRVTWYLIFTGRIQVLNTADAPSGASPK